jgi:transposase
MDIAKKVFQIHGIDENDEVCTRKQLRRSQVLNYFAKINPCLIGMEACSGAHYWARELTRLGHTVRLMSPQHVKPYIKGNKNDNNDAAGICEAVTRPSMRFVGVKSTAQQDILLIHRVRALRLKTRTALVNQIRGLLTEYGIVLPKRVENLRKHLVRVIAEDPQLSDRAREHFYGLYEELLLLDDQVQKVEQSLMAVFKHGEVCQRLATLPGIGPISATALVAHIGDIKAFKNGRELAAYFGLVPRQHSTGGKPVLLGISKRGDSYIRTLLIHGARAVQRFAPKKVEHDAHSRWLVEVEQRRGKNKAAVAQANKTARRVWALLTHGTTYQAAA